MSNDAIMNIVGIGLPVLIIVFIVFASKHGKKNEDAK